jgi:DNA-binding NarL/FixJ family response regulator
MKQPRILLADDHALVLEGIRRVLAPHYKMTGTVTDGRALVVAALRLKPDLIISDITMPHLNGIDAAIQIKASLPAIKLLFVSAHSSSAYVTAAFEAGGTGYVLKSAVLGELLDAVQSVLKGRMYVSSGLSTELLGRFQHPTAAISRLSKREHETLRLIAEGRTAE